MRLSGTAYNGSEGQAAEGAVVTLTTVGGAQTYSAFVGSDGTWTLSIPGNPGTNSTLTMTFQGRTRIISTRNLILGMSPSWSPYWMSVLSHRNSTGVSRNGVVPNSQGSFQVSLVGPNTLTISSGAVAHTDYDSDDNWWIGSWEEATTFPFQQFNAATNAYQAVSTPEPGEGWMLGVERQSDGRTVFQVASVSGTTGVTPQASYSGIIGGFNDNFIPLARVTRSGGAITSVVPYRNYLFEGRAVMPPVLSVVGGQTGSLVTYDGVGSTAIDSSSLSITDRSAGRYAVEGKAQVLTRETGAIPYWQDTSHGTTGSGDSQFNNPGQLAKDGSGNIYVADTANNRLKKHDSSGTYVTSITSLTGIIGVCVDTSGNVYVGFRSAVSDYRIRKYNSSLSLQWTSNKLSTSGIMHLATDNTHVYANLLVNTVSKLLCSTGGSETAIAGAGSGDGQFNTPVGIAFDGTYLYVVDQGNTRIQKLTAAGAFVAKWGFYGTGNGQFDVPYGISVVPGSGNILVTDYGNHSIQEFTNTGTFVRKLSFLDPIGVVSVSSTVFWVARGWGVHSIHKLEYVTPVDGLEWYDLQCEMFYKINAGSWVSLGSKNVPNFSVMPDFWNFSEDSGSISLTAGDVIAFRVTLSNTDTGSIAWDTMNYQFRLVPLGSV